MVINYLHVRGATKPLLKAIAGRAIFSFGVVIALTGCPLDGDDTVQVSSLSTQDEQLYRIMEQSDLAVDPSQNRTFPSIDDPIAQLGKKLFFTKSLSGEFDVACASCHHPMLGGSDELSLPVGVEAVQINVLGVGRKDGDGLPNVPRNSPTTFNVALWDQGLFWDSRVESLTKAADMNGEGGGISSPDSGFNIVDENGGDNLVSTQARFPITSADEMKGHTFESEGDNTSVRDHLAARLGDYGIGLNELTSPEWLAEFQLAFDSDADAESLITYDNIGLALGEYQRSMVFVDTPWHRYLDGDLEAITAQQKAGALLFFLSVDEGGAGCVACHNGDLFTDEQNHAIGFPQIGEGKGNGTNGTDDFGRELVTGLESDRYKFRTPGLINVEVTFPYGHAGVYQTLEEAIRQHESPRDMVSAYFDAQQWCDLPQFIDVDVCADLYPEGRDNSLAAVSVVEAAQQSNTSLLQTRVLTDEERQQLVTFIQSLTDPCVKERACMAPWIAQEGDDDHDGQLLLATDAAGSPL
ncbi:cytochrome-c peroxidase [Thaumasiovibrio sp. DFM-14]|uniref:cytochrome-c peroxidase n=1 Tax=Thaumasiovibrio sp. DFM-14 TaxID=3384792 RepID=UPI0039A1A685